MTNNSDLLQVRLDMAYQRHASDNMEGAIDALAAVIEFLKAEGAAAHETLPLIWLAHHMTDKTPGKPLFEAGQWAIAAAAVDMLKKSGVKLDVACERIARATGGALVASQLKDFRKNVSGYRQRVEVTKQYEQNKKILEQKLNEMLPDKARWETFLVTLVSETFGRKKV